MNNEKKERRTTTSTSRRRRRRWEPLTVVIAWLSLVHTFFCGVRVFVLYLARDGQHLSLLCLETTSESGVSDLETSMTDFRCTCCPYGYHLDTDFMKFLDDMYGPDVLRTLKKIERKRHDVRRRLINDQVMCLRLPSLVRVCSDSDVLDKVQTDADVLRVRLNHGHSIGRETIFTLIVLVRVCALVSLPR